MGTTNTVIREQNLAWKRIWPLVTFCLMILALSLFILAKHIRYGSLKSRLNACEGQLLRLQSYKTEYAISHSLSKDDVVLPQDIRPYMRPRWEDLRCPEAGSNTYVLGRVGEDAACTFHGTPGFMRLRGIKRHRELQSAVTWPLQTNR